MRGGDALESDHKDEIFKKLEDLLPPKQYEKRELGEVFTPLQLIEDILEHLPKKVWSNPELNWFEPSVGVGNFMVCVFYRLMEGLKKVFPEERKRHRHIVTKMLFMSEINAKNVDIIKILFGKDCNIFLGDTIKQLNIKEEWDIESFDITVGNPPFQMPGSSKSNGANLWPDFVNLAFEHTKKGGYVALIHPPGWKQPPATQGKLCGLYEKLCKTNWMIHLNMYNVQHGKKIFKSNTAFDWYVVEINEPRMKETNVRDQQGVRQTLRISQYDWMPNYNFEKVLSLVAVGDEERCPILYSYVYTSTKSDVLRERTESYKYPVVRSTTKDGPKFMYTNDKTKVTKKKKKDESEEAKNFGVSKVIFGNSGINEPVIDIKGKYGMTEHAMGIRVENNKEAERVSNALQSESFQRDVVGACIYAGFQIKWRMFANFKRDWWKIVEGWG